MSKKNKKQKVAKVAPVASIDWAAQAVAARGEYGAPVEALFSFGEVDFQQKWPDYEGLVFSEADVPELARMACDVRLDFAESLVALSAPIHAMRILALRGNTEFLPALFVTFDQRDDYDLFHEEMPALFAAIGPTVIPVVQEFFAQPEKSPYSRASISNGLVAIAKKQRAAYDRVVEVLMGELARYEDNSEEWNGFLIADFIDLAAGEALPLIEKVFAADAVDYMVCGDLRDVRAEFGLAPRRRDFGPLFLKNTRSVFPDSLRSYPSRKIPKRDN